MSTKPDSSELATFPSSAWNESDSGFAFPLFTIPSWAQIEKATIQLSLSYTPSYSYVSSYDHDVPFGPEPVDKDNPTFTPGAMSVDVANQAAIDNIFIGPITGGAGCSFSNPASAINLRAIGADPCLMGTVGILIQFHASTALTPHLISPGFNSWEIFYYWGANEADLTATLDVTYTPEPSSLVFFLTGAAALAFFLCYKRKADGLC